MSRVKGRTDDMIMLKGAKFFPSQLFDAVLSAGGVIPLCRIVLDRKDNMDTLDVCVAVSSDADFIDEIKTLESLRRNIAGRIESAVGVAAKVSFMEEGTLQAEARGKKQPIVMDKRNE
jgi:phenylacetate-CoA ligase